MPLKSRAPVFRAATSRRLGTDAAALVTGRVISAGCGLVQVPFVLQHLGREGFGLFTALAGLLWTLGILDGGLGYALQNRLARLLAAQRAVEAANLLRCGAALLGWIGGGVALLGGLFAYALPWADWLGVKEEVWRHQTPAAVATCFSLAGLMLPLALSARATAARQETWITGLWTAIGSVTSLAAVLTAVSLCLPLAAFVAAAGLLPLTLYLGQAWHLHRLFPPGADGVHDPAFNLRTLGRESLLFAIPQASAALVGAFVPTLIALFAESDTVAGFSVLHRLFGLLLQVTLLVLQPTWPAYTHAAAQGNPGQAKRVFRFSVLAAMAGAGAMLGVAAPLAQHIVDIWLRGNSLPIDSLLLWSVAAWNALQCLGQPPAIVLNGLGRNELLAVLGWIAPLLSLFLCTFLGPRLGAVGILVALATPYLALNLPCVYWYARSAIAELTPVSTRR